MLTSIVCPLQVAKTLEDPEKLDQYLEGIAAFEKEKREESCLLSLQLV